MHSRPDLEILICTHNRVALLERALDSLDRAHRPDACRVSVLVAANACSDGTEEMLARRERGGRQEGRLPLRWIQVPTPGKSVALNRAVDELVAPVVAFVDDDHRVDEGYLAGVVDAVRRYPDVELFCGRIIPDWDGSEPEWVHDQGPYRIYPLPVPRFDQGESPRVIEPGTVTPGGGDLFMRKTLFERVGPFSTDLGPVGHNLGGAEDIEWVRRAMALGETLQYVPTVTQYHYVDSSRLSLRYLMRKAYERSMASVRVAEKIEVSDRLPPYLVRKPLGYAAQALFSVSSQRRRHYLVRTAAALGELRGYLRRQGHLRTELRRKES